MQEQPNPYCPECEGETGAQQLLHRRSFIRNAGESAAGLIALGGLAAVPAVATAKVVPVKKPAKPAEELVKELYASLTGDQKKDVVMAWDHGSANGRRLPTRMGMYNRYINKPIGSVYTKAQQELITKILRAISSDDEGYRRITRNGTFDGSRSLQGCGANIFGEPGENTQFAWVFTGHHLTVRCDGNSEEGAAFGGPIYYGHSPNGYSERNIFNYQTKSVLSVFDALSEKQRKVAVITGTPGELYPSVRFREATQPKPGLSYGEMNKEQRALVEEVMHDVLSPYRQEDVKEVMQIIKANGGMAKIHLAFYEDRRVRDNQRWHFWRLEGPGFVWNYRVLPHVHTYVNIATEALRI
jgi:hypothetical protein